MSLKSSLAVASLLLATGALAQRLHPPPTGGPAVGEPISMAVKDGDLAEVLRLFAHVGQMNLVLDPAISGRTVTIMLDAVPWEQAMSVVLQSQGLASASDGNVIRVAPAAKLISEENQKAQLREAREQSGELRTISVSLSNADATQAEAIIRKSLTSRGYTSIDRRTNTIFITDVFEGGGPDGEMLELAPLSQLAEESPRVASFEVQLLEVEDPNDGDLSGLASLAGARLLGSERVVLGTGQRTTLLLGNEGDGNAVSMSLSPQRDGERTVLVVRAAPVGRGGIAVGHALPLGSEQAIVMPGMGGPDRSLVLIFVPR